MGCKPSFSSAARLGQIPVSWLTLPYSWAPSGWGEGTPPSYLALHLALAGCLLLNSWGLSPFFWLLALCLCHSGWATWNYQRSPDPPLHFCSLAHAPSILGPLGEGSLPTVCHTVSSFENKVCCQTSYHSSGLLPSHILFITNTFTSWGQRNISRKELSSWFSKNG